MFQTTIVLFDRYYCQADSFDEPGFNRDLGCEVRKRLEQLEFLVTRVGNLTSIAELALARSENAQRSHIDSVLVAGLAFETTTVPPDTQITKEEFATNLQAMFEIELYTEAFYYLAGRIRTILRHNSTPLPGLAGFESVGVRNVRNKLLEHAEGNDSKVSIQSFGWGGPNGPSLKAARYSGQEAIFPDGGLYANAEEFRSKLDRLLQDYLDRNSRHHRIVKDKID